MIYMISHFPGLLQTVQCSGGVKELVEESIINIHILKQPLINYKKSIIHNKIDFH